jgi:hypothetical protein
MIKFVTDDVDVTAAGRPIIVTGQSTGSAPHASPRTVCSTVGDEKLDVLFA